jgi:hypothetical protein
MKTKLTLIIALAGCFLCGNIFALTGAIFSTDSTCHRVDQNIYDSKAAVYVDGGPNVPNGSGLPPGTYCVRVTEPNGTVLGVSAPGAVTVDSNGNFVQCYQLTSILYTASSGFTVLGYDDTTNAGGEYKVWVSPDCNFDPNNSKTDNFKVRENPPPPPFATICVTKFYDANANGVQDGSEPYLVGWEYCVVGNNNFSALRFTLLPGDAHQCLNVDPNDNYSVTEGTPIETTWVHTTPTQDSFYLGAGATHDTTFGNVCLGAGGGLTLGFWSNKNGQRLEGPDDFAMLSALNLVDSAGHDKDFLSGNNKTNQDALNTWLLSANATNMAYMLSAQLAAMELNVYNGFVTGSSLVYAPCLLNFSSSYPTPGLTTLGFISISDLMSAANQILLPPGNNTVSASTLRSYEECLKTTLDNGNNNLNFVQSSPCPFSFSPNTNCPFTNP